MRSRPTTSRRAVAGPRTVYRASFDFGFELPSPESSVSVDPPPSRLPGDFGR